MFTPVTINRNRIPIVDIAKQQRPLQIDDLEALKQAGVLAWNGKPCATRRRWTKDFP